MENKTHELEKEEYAVGLLGYKLVPASNSRWNILDKDGNIVGDTVYENHPFTDERYYTNIHGNGITYSNSRTKPDKYFHYEFKDDNNYTIVIIDLDGDDREIEIWRNFKDVYRLSLKTGEDGKGFEVSTTNFGKTDANGRAERTSLFLKYTIKPYRILCNGEIFKGDLFSSIARPIIIEMYEIFSNLPFEKEMGEIIGYDDIKKCGLNDLFGTAYTVRKIREEQKKEQESSRKK